MRTHKRGIRPSVVAAAGLCVVSFLTPGPAFAGGSVSVVPTFPPVVAVGNTGVPVYITITNTSTSTATVANIFLTPSCDSNASPTCPTPGDEEPGVFDVNTPGTGRAGTACAGLVFTVVLTEPLTGEVEFVPVPPGGPPVLGPSATCIIDFTINVLKLPIVDVDPLLPGFQTYTLAHDPFGTASEEDDTAFGFDKVTVCSDAVPACPCLNANPRLGPAAECAVLQTGPAAQLKNGAGGLSMSGRTRIAGEVCIGQGGSLKASGTALVTRSILLDPGPPPSTCRSKSPNVACTDAIVTELDTQSDGCDNASTTAAAMTCTIGNYTQSLTALAGLTKPKPNPPSATISGAAGVNVICVDAVDLADSAAITLTGTPTTTFIINVRAGGPFKLSGGSTIKAGDPVQSSDVLYNIIGSGPKVSLSGATEIDGTIVAIDREISLSGGVVNGQLCAGRNIKLSSDAMVQCTAP
jgi:choice-of-anchor A domain-containing protein